MTRLSPYAETPARRARQVLGDLVVALVVLVLGLLARTVHEAVQLLGAPGRELQQAGAGLREALTRAAEGAGDLPLVGGQLRGPLDAAAGSGTTLERAGAAQETAVERLALVLALLVLLPALALLVRHLRRRYDEARSAGAARALRGDVELLALRAATRAPLLELARLGPAPVTAWRQGDPEAARQLAALELRRLGLRPTGPAAP